MNHKLVETNSKNTCTLPAPAHYFKANKLPLT